MEKFSKPLKLRIGIDICGVIADIGPSLEKILSKRQGRQVKKEEIITYNLKHMGVESHEYKDIFNKDFYTNLKPIKDAIDIINCLYDKNYISLITSRNQYSEVMKDTFDWLIDNGILFDNLIQSDNKVEPMKSEELDFLIDDHFGTCYNLAKNKINSYLFEQPWNKYSTFSDDLEFKHIKRAKNWKDVAHQINQCQKVYK